MNDQLGIIDVIGLTFDDLKSVQNDRLKKVLSRIAEAPEVPSAGFQSAI
ncbi:hypothetical protein [Planotetraspora kaengkrachanensis]|uniref:FXSXX-COOH protein n=1 Tax=Planotetraspora kaengkrachanensis TaxID=575193 RepID=A0A8J3VB47_9ACTN|nr:hypothetical protein [Planotetraspora kaengkrachanensis]GIG83324.1 hypothetical protein Pka01_64510 [Planotetraspora kaengkrachanensis]